MKRKATFALAGVMMTAFFACQRDYQGPTEVPGPIEATGTPGTRPENPPTPSGSLVPAVLNVVVTEFGQVTLSQDALGTNAGVGTVEIVKPAGATVRSAHFFAASRGFSGFMIPNGAITLNGTPVNWAQTVPCPISCFSHYAPVTGHVAATLNAAPAGIVPITIDEGANTFNIEANILAVIWNDPTSPSTTNTVNLLFGGQSVAGDQFSLNLGQPFAATDVMNMSLGISFGFQPSGQVSLVDVNSQRLTSCAGGHDDGQAANGALATVGGTGDSNANPDPNCSGGAGPLIDDELYNLVPFIPVGSTTIQVNTINPSNDDNIFYASFFSNIPTGVDEPPPNGGGGEDCPTAGPSSPGVTRLTLPLGVTFHTGTFGNDVIIGTAGRDIIIGRDGDDLACGLGDTDVFFGGLGDDQWFGGSGNDAGFGNEGSDELNGGPGSDRNDGGHGGPPNAVDTDTDTCAGEFNFLCEVSGPDAAISSARFKTDIRSILPGGATVLGLRPVSYRYRAPFGDPSVVKVGLVAEEVAQVYPEVVMYSYDSRPTAVQYDVLGARVTAELGRRIREALSPTSLAR